MFNQGAHEIHCALVFICSYMSLHVFTCFGRFLHVPTCFYMFWAKKWSPDFWGICQTCSRIVKSRKSGTCNVSTGHGSKASCPRTLNNDGSYESQRIRTQGGGGLPWHNCCSLAQESACVYARVCQACKYLLHREVH